MDDLKKVYQMLGLMFYTLEDYHAKNYDFLLRQALNHLRDSQMAMEDYFWKKGVEVPGEKLGFENTQEVEE